MHAANMARGAASTLAERRDARYALAMDFIGIVRPIREHRWAGYALVAAAAFLPEPFTIAQLAARVWEALAASGSDG